MNKGFTAFIKENKRILKIGLIAALGIVLILISSSVGASEKNEKDGEITLDEYKERLEAELSDLCSDVQGVGKCRVFVTFERGEQNTYKGSAVTETKPPKVLGITVICKGADSDRVRSELTDMLTSLFDIGSNRVAVLKLN